MPVNRYYDPTTDQFISVDPVVSVTGQPFSFAGDNPVNGSDPSGLDPDDEDPAEFAGGNGGGAGLQGIDDATEQYEHGGAQYEEAQTDRDLNQQAESDCDGNYTKAGASADERKFSQYVFAEGDPSGKGRIFSSYGYSAADSDELAREFESQANRAFAAENYTLGDKGNTARESLLP